MPHYRRSYQPGGYYFFTVVTPERRGFLTSELARECLRNAWKKVRINYPFQLIAFCLLPDHIHCIWQLPEKDSDYSRRWAALKASFSKAYIEKGGIEGQQNRSRNSKGEKAIWQRRFWEHLIRDEEDLKKHIDYIHYNPLKHGLVDNIDDWRWSTYSRYCRDGYYNNNRLLEPPYAEFAAGE